MFKVNYTAMKQPSGFLHFFHFTNRFNFNRSFAQGSQQEK